MKEKIIVIAAQIKTNLQNEIFLTRLISKPDSCEIIKQIDDYISKINETENETVGSCICLMLKITTELNMPAETHVLLELNILDDINQPLLFEFETTKSKSGDHGKTLLGIAAFHGHLGLVKYLVDVRTADVNVQDIHGNTPLHQAVYGDSYPFNNCNYGSSHDEVAKYLLLHGGDLSVKNNENKTPYDATKWCAPLAIENLIGRRFITNTGSALYYADKVRPVLENELKKIERSKHGHELVIFSARINQSEDYNLFRLKFAIEQYITNGEIPCGYPIFDQIINKLDNLSEEEWMDLRRIISSQKPVPYSFKYRIIANQLSRITKQSIVFGLLASLITYYLTKSILMTATTGLMSSAFAWQCLTEIAYKVECRQRITKEDRINQLLQHDRFFKPAQPSSLEIQQLTRIEEELQKLDGGLEAGKQLSLKNIS